MIKQVIFVILISLVICSQYVPVSKEKIGMFIGNSTGKIQLQFICDPMCYDCATFTQKSFRPFMKNLSNEINKQLGLRIVSFAKSTHITAHKMTQAIIYIKNKIGTQKAIKLFFDCFNEIQNWNETSLENQTIAQWMRKLSSVLNQTMGIDEADLFKELAHGSETEHLAREWYKYVTGSKFLSATPALYVNGARVDGLMSMSSQNLQKLISSLLEADDL